MRNIIIVECMSTGINFIKDCLKNNCNPIILKTKLEDTPDSKVYNDIFMDYFNGIEEDVELIHEKDTYDETLSMARDYDPLLVLAGSERGVILATKLANDLNLKCNPIENLDAITLKDKMQDKIAEKGLRHIRGKAIHTIEEAIQYYDKEGFDEVVVKPTYSQGSTGVRICLNKQEMINSLEQLFEQSNIYGVKNSEFVIQERIKGEEYVVDTVSCNGKHRVTAILKYKKIKTPEGGYIYDYVKSVSELNLGEADIVDYAYDVADALGIRYGPVHGEYMVDDKGPVLIEVNCRPIGANMDAPFLDSFLGHHDTDCILDSYLNPEKFEYECKKEYKLYGHGALKFIIIPQDIVAKSSPLKYISNNLKSYHKSTQGIIDEAKYFTKTQDLNTSGGTIYLTHPDEYQLKKDLDFLRSLERNAFQLVFSDDTHKNTDIDEEMSVNESKSILKNVKAYGTTLFVTDQIIEDIEVLQVLPDNIDNTLGDFSCVVVNLNKSLVEKNDEDIANLFLKIIDSVKVGGLIFIPKSTYKYIPNGRIGAEALIKVLDLKLELPLHNFNKMIIASKN